MDQQRMKMMKRWALALIVSVAPHIGARADVPVLKVEGDLAKSAFEDATWKSAKWEEVGLLAQPMAVPRPKTTTTEKIRVQAAQDGTSLALRLRWKATTKAEAGKLGQFSDAVAVQFPIKDPNTTPIFMGGKDAPVHIFHWRAQYQRDLEQGKPEMKTLYPNLNIDMYPMEFKDSGKVGDLSEEKRELFSPGKSAGNPQSYSKQSSVDEIVAEGYSTSAVMPVKSAQGKGIWKDGEWSVTLVRPLRVEGGSEIDATKGTSVAFAVWQGAKQEVGSRKCVTMNWIPLQMGNKSAGSQP